MLLHGRLRAVAVGSLVAGTLALTPVPGFAGPPDPGPGKGTHVPATMLRTSSCVVPSTADDDVLVTMKHVVDRENVTSKVRLATYETAWVESHANDLDCGDASSIGVFQQRPDYGWIHAGDPELATYDFLHGNPSDSSLGAIELDKAHPTWSAGQIAQAVQRSAYPDRYDAARDTALGLIDRARSLDVVDKGASGVVKPDGSKNPIVFSRSNASGRLMYRQRTSTGWGDWVEPSGATAQLGSGPDASSRSEGQYDVVARGTDGRVLLAWKTPTDPWHSFIEMSSFTTKYAPAIVAVDSSTMFMFAVRDPDGALMRRRWESGSGWGTWDRVSSDSGFTSGPDATKKVGVNGVAVAVRGAGGNIRVFHWANNVWDTTADQWDAPLAGVKEGTAPAIASRATGSLDVLVSSPTGSIHRRTVTNGVVTVDWQKPGNLNQGSINHGPDIVANSSTGALTLFARDSGGGFVKSDMATDGTWSVLSNW